jgi:hypothetical protein
MVGGNGKGPMPRSYVEEWTCIYAHTCHCRGERSSSCLAALSPEEEPTEPTGGLQCQAG